MLGPKALLEVAHWREGERLPRAYSSACDPDEQPPIEFHSFLTHGCVRFADSRPALVLAQFNVGAERG